MHEKEHVIEILEKTQDALKRDDVFKLKELSNQTVHTASTEQDTDSILIAVIIYSLSKIIERRNQFNKDKTDAFCKSSSYHLSNSAIALKNDNIKLFEKNLNNIIESINKLSSDFKNDIQDVFQRARINKASKIYEHGISMGQTSKLLGITQYELANYIGPIEDRTAPLVKTFSVKDRIKLAMSFFK